MALLVKQSADIISIQEVPYINKAIFGDKPVHQESLTNRLHDNDEQIARAMQLQTPGMVEKPKYHKSCAKRVSFAHDDPDLLMKPKPAVIAEYTIGCPGIDWIKTAEEHEAEVNAAFLALKQSKNAWKPRRSSRTVIIEPTTEEEDMQNAIAELEELAGLMMVN